MGDTVSYVCAIGIFTIVFALLIKLSSFPHHVWAVDVYDGASMFLVSMLVVIAKTTSFFTLINFLSVFPIGGTEYLSEVLCFLGVMSMIVGTFGAIRQQRLKRFLAYSSIGHMGYILLSMGAVPESAGAVLYFLAYLFGTVLLFSILLGIRR